MTPQLPLLTTLALPAFGARNGSFWLPEQASTFAHTVDNVFYLIYWICVVGFVATMLAMAYFVWKYRARPGHKAQPSPSHNMVIELTWTIVPIFIVVGIFTAGLLGFVQMKVPPKNSYNINVTGIKWAWAFQYPNGHVDNVLHIPLGEPVLLTMTSDDVLHSLYIPAFRAKMDVVPGRYTKLWFQATKAGTFPLRCAEYCGKEHFAMLSSVVVSPRTEFDAWLEDAANFLNKMPPAEAGAKLVQMRGCLQCHTVDGSAKTGPSFQGVWERSEVMKDGSKLTVDENYLRESIFEPQAKVVAGFDPVMPTFKGRLKDAEITAIIEYLKTLK